MCEQPGTPCPKHDVPAPIPADPERDARVAARRAADARKAGAAFDRLLAETWTDRTTGRAYFVKWYREGFRDGWSDGYAASELQHNRAYGVPACTCAEPSGLSGCEQHMPVKLTKRYRDENTSVQVAASSDPRDHNDNPHYGVPGQDQRTRSIRCALRKGIAPVEDCPCVNCTVMRDAEEIRPTGFTGPMHDTCIETTGYGEVLAGTRSWVCGQDCPGVAS